MLRGAPNGLTGHALSLFKEDRSENGVQEDRSVASLIARAAQRDPAAFGTLYEMYFPRIYRYVLLKVGNAADAEDVTASVFLSAWRAVDRFVPQAETSFLGWLLRQAHNATVDRLRRYRATWDLQAVDESVMPVDWRFDPEQALDWQLTIDELRTAMGLLTEEQREVVLLRFVEGLSAREVGEIMGKQESTVRGLQFRALDALRRLLAPEKVRRADG
jgi:RNA polymerase sigma-70 factor (ECF subfamily)